MSYLGHENPTMPDKGTHGLARSRTDRAVVYRPPTEVDPEQRNFAPCLVAEDHLYLLRSGKRRLQIIGRGSLGPAAGYYKITTNMCI